MVSKLVSRSDVQTLLDKAGGLNVSDGDERLKRIVRRIVEDLFETIDDFDVSEDEFWHALNFLASAGPELGLLAPGLGFEHFLDIRADEADRLRGTEGGTPRTIEGPLYVPGAPQSKGEARLDDGSDEGDVLFMHGRVLDVKGRPVPDALVEVWHANSMGNYSYFDPGQSPYNLRRAIQTNSDGSYSFRSIVPAGYSVPPEGPTDQLLQRLGRHGNRPAHIHFFVSAPGFRHLTTQINIAGDSYLHDDFAFATRDELIVNPVRRDDPSDIASKGLNAPYFGVEFDFTLRPAQNVEEERLSNRPRVPPIEETSGKGVQ